MLVKRVFRLCWVGFGEDKRIPTFITGWSRRRLRDLQNWERGFTHDGLVGKGLPLVSGIE
jgi:hypothetical protein